MRCGSHAAADRFPVFWGLDLKWTAWYTEIRPIILTINFDLRKIQIASNLPERNYCAVEGVCVCVCVCVRCTHLELTNVTTDRQITPGGTRPKWYTVAYNYLHNLINPDTVKYRLCNYAPSTTRWKWGKRTAVERLQRVLVSNILLQISASRSAPIIKMGLRRPSNGSVSVANGAP